VVSWIPLSPESRDLIRTSAAGAQLPIEIWVRIAVEASRLVFEIADLSGRLEEEVQELLGHVASQNHHLSTSHLAASGLERYAEELGNQHEGGPLDAELSLRLPEEMNAAWSHAAAKARLSYSDWFSERLTATPPQCVQWEITAARNCQSLGEWSYASFLRALAI
jgi:hypothetical protein